MRRAWFGWVILCALVCASGCRAPSPDWDGTWRLNLSKSSYQGQVLAISISADGEYHFDEGSSHALRCDGKERPIKKNQTLACVKSGVTALDITLKENGAKTRATRDELSTDGRSFTTTVTELRPNGPVVTSQMIFSRLSGNDDFTGRWLDTSYLQQHTDMKLRLDSQALHIRYPDSDQQIDAQLNGVETAVLGPHVLEGSTFAVQPVGRREFRTETKRQGKIFSQGTLELSKDGRVITASWWNPSQPSDKGTLVYDKR